MSDINSLELIQKALSGGRTQKVLRFLMGILGGTPYVGGAIGASATAWSEAEQTKVNVLILNALKVHDEWINEIDKKLVDVSNKKWVVAYIKFKPNSFEFVDTSNVSSLTDNGHLDFTINFTSALTSKFVLQCFGSSEVKLKSVEETKTHVRIQLLEPTPEIVTFVFFNLD
ncbi:hypothetical protein [Comamonas jiangduensis]|uniref:hypothetical protein n=1 Tax=Comamonas jiangduensis TaxID=1194168 RepID=UPI0028ABBCF3|nr:hypothetical protein [Comamonas jiangduensis]